MEMHDGVAGRVQKSHKLCDKDRVHHSRSSKPVRFAAEEFMRKVNTTSIVAQDVTVAELYEENYLPYIEDVVPLTGEPRLKPSAVKSVSLRVGIRLATGQAGMVAMPCLCRATVRIGRQIHPRDVAQLRWVSAH